MAKTVVGLFDDATSKRVESELLGAGFARKDILCRRTASTSDLETLGIPRSDLGRYESAMKSGRTLVIAETSDIDADKASDIMRRYELAEARTARAATAATTDIGRAKATDIGRAKKTTEREVVIPVVEEELEVGKREIESGGIHVMTRVIDKPVDVDVSLREEHVHVDRRRVDRPATEADIDAARSAGDIEMREHAERVVVAKTAHVVEEVRVSKDIDEHVEHVHDTVRKTEVAVQPLAGYDAALLREHRGHFDRTFGSTEGATWETYEPAYRMGHTFALDRRYGGREWTAIERDVRTRWETENPGTWERVKDAIRHSFDRARGAMGAPRHA
ncbi:YsnF/AvaK domain-containing protein [Sandaracinus amylolyticus]|uniref:YsnF/AvaK domain-containing protein n=1 Tax=Sandaracinus amylolyticus TaxID=927083 RepID=UPI001F47FB0D|nr:YsnF/AvaK domain-containing protein [Sandaracinus amylolyticus]UJR86023.1 Hypothetical protein I5071_81040 [Sandaracinus amylolyticus]